jgi:hypothetical protein
VGLRRARDHVVDKSPTLARTMRYAQHALSFALLPPVAGAVRVFGAGGTRPLRRRSADSWWFPAAVSERS